MPKLSLRKCLLFIAFLGALCAPAAFASNEAEAGTHAEEGGPSLGLKWVNFGLFALAIGYLVVKTGPAFFNARTDQIQKAIKDATGLKMDADFRASEVDRKLATLGAEVERLRAESQAEMAGEHARLQKETALAVTRINERLLLEVASLRQNASNALRRHVADLAASMAASRLRDHLSAEEQSQLIHSFSDRVSRGAI